jgi:hypothetical protein
MTRNDAVWLITGCLLATCVWSWTNWQDIFDSHPGCLPRGLDYKIYAYAALGDTHWFARAYPDYANLIPGWIYKDWLRYFWFPFAVYGKYGMYAWMMFMWGMYLFVAHKAMKEPYGIFVVLITVKPLITLLINGNVSFLLSIMVLTPSGAVLAGLVKPYLLGFVALLAFAGHLERSRRLP